MITFQIYLSAKDVKHALKMRDELLAGGVKEESIAFPAPMVARSASPSSPRAASLILTDASKFTLPAGRMMLSQLESHWQKATGANFRCTPEMAEKFSLPSERGERIVKLCALLASGEVVRCENPVKYLFANEVRGQANGSGESEQSETIDGADEIDPDFVP